MTILAGKKMVSTSHMDNSLSLFVNSALCKNFILLLLAFFLNVINDWVSLPEHTSAVGESNTSLLESTPRTCIGGTGPCYGEKDSLDAHFVFELGLTLFILHRVQLLRGGDYVNIAFVCFSLTLHNVSMDWWFMKGPSASLSLIFLQA